MKEQGGFTLQRRGCVEYEFARPMSKNISVFDMILVCQFDFIRYQFLFTPPAV